VRALPQSEPSQVSLDGVVADVQGKNLSLKPGDRLCQSQEDLTYKAAWIGRCLIAYISVFCCKIA